MESRPISVRDFKLPGDPDDTASFQRAIAYATEPPKLKCPKCVEAGLRSSVRVLYTTTPAVGCPDYYDEDGNFHAGKQPRSVKHCECSNRHHFTTRST